MAARYTNFEYMSDMQCLIRAQSKTISDLKSGEAYRKLQENHRKLIAEKNSEIATLKAELCSIRQELKKVNRNWLEVLDDVEEEYTAKLLQKDKEFIRMEERALGAERRCYEYQDRIKALSRQVAELSAKIEVLDDKAKKLTAQMNHNYENSSIPSSMTKNARKITNNREKSEKKPGAQEGHPHHGRKRQKPTNTVYLTPPSEYLDPQLYTATGEMLTKQVVSINVALSVTDYCAQLYRNNETGLIVHAPFPYGVKDDVNYDGTVKGFAFLLNNHCCVSIDKTSNFINEITDGNLSLSKGMISKLSKEFAQKSEKEQKEILSQLLTAPVMNTDATNVRVNGKGHYVYVCANANEAMYYAREKKGHKGIEGTAVENYMGILVHDHDVSFYSYGSNHQECLAHILRYLKDSMENEKELTWNEKMRTLLQEMIHYRKGLSESDEINEEKAEYFRRKYTEYLRLAEKEYTQSPPADYYKEGYNLYRRMEKYKDNHLLFLSDKRVPYDNNRSERLLRNMKRKAKQVIAFRSEESLDYLCQNMSVVTLTCSQEQNLFAVVTEIFNR